jgi:hypothetical protein
MYCGRYIVSLKSKWRAIWFQVCLVCYPKYYCHDKYPYTDVDIPRKVKNIFLF